MDIKIILEGLENIDAAETIRKECEQLDYVVSAEIEFVSQTLSVQTGGGVKKQDCLNDILEIISSQGGGISAYEEGNQPSKYGQKSYTIDIIRIIICIILTTLSYLMPVTLIKLIFLVMGYFAISYNIIWRALKSLLRFKPFSSDVLITVSSIGTFILGHRIESSVVMLLYSFGQMIKELAVERSRESIVNLSELKADKVTVYHEGITEQCRPQYIPVGARIFIKPGEVISFDGTVAKGKSAIDTSVITGNSAAVEVGPGDKVISGCTNLTASIEVITSAEYKNSTVSKLLEICSKSNNKKSAAEKFAVRFSDMFTYCAAGIAILTALIGAVAGGEPLAWIYKGLQILAVGGMSMLAISVSLDFFAANGVASSDGVIVKGSNVLENLAKCSTVIFDKTSALSDGTIKISQIIPFNEYPEEELVKYCAFAQNDSDELFKAPVLERYGGAVHTEELETEVFEGKGIKCIYNKKDIILCGSYGFLAENEIRLPADQKGIFLHAALNGNYIGKIEFEEQLRGDVPELLKKVKGAGIHKTVIISSDSNETAERAAQQTGADSGIGEMHPSDRAMEIEMMMAKGEHIVYISDGMNDGASIAKADTGVVIGGVASEAAINTADIVIMDKKPDKIIKVIQTAHKAQEIFLQNMLLAVVSKAIIIILSMLGMANMAAVVVADTAISSLIIFNSMRLFKARQR